MKIQKTSQWFSLLLFVMVVTSCTQSTGSTIPPSATASILLVSASPTETMLPTLTSTATGTPTPAFTPTTVPTLPAEDARKRLLELLTINGGCQLPCLWGITPGKSVYQEARNILIPLSSVAEFPPYFDPSKVNGILVGVISPLYVEDDLRLNARVRYIYGDDGVVSSVYFRVLEEGLYKKDEYGNQIKTPIYDSPTFGKRVEYYSLSHVLSEQGIPDSVMIYIPRVEGYPISVNGILEAALLYPEQGIWIKYAMSMYNNGNIIKGCPANAHIEMQLYPSGYPESFFSLLEKTDWGRTKGGYKPLKEATSMSIEEFYETFRNSTNMCIETPVNMWTTPEQ